MNKSEAMRRVAADYGVPVDAALASLRPLAGDTPTYPVIRVGITLIVERRDPFAARRGCSDVQKNRAAYRESLRFRGELADRLVAEGVFADTQYDDRPRGDLVSARDVALSEIGHCLSDYMDFRGPLWDPLRRPS